MTGAWLTACMLLLGLGGCSSLKGPLPAWRGDGAPAAEVAAHEVVDAVPRADPILAAGNTSPYVVEGVTYTVLPSAAGYSEQGIASWYGTKFHGRKTANGEEYDLYQPTAAHRSLPIPSYVRVTNLDNGADVIVRVNDRGPFHPDRLIDLSYAAAVKLGFVDKGTAPVSVEVLDLAHEDRRNDGGGRYRYLQLGAFSNLVAADNLRAAVANVVDVPVTVTAVDVAGKRLNRVRVGPVADGSQLLQLRDLLLARGFSPGLAMP